MEHLQVGAADAGHVTADDDLADTGGGSVEIDVRDLMWPLDEDGLHPSTVLRSRSRSAG